MALAPIQLDDLTWLQMTSAIRDRIAAASARQWALHAPVDPGITMLELFSALLEQRLYWMDQPSDSLRRALLKLLGTEPRTVRATRTVLSVDGPAKRLLQFQDLPAGTVMYAKDSAGQKQAGGTPVLTTSWPITALPVTRNPEITQDGRGNWGQIGLIVDREDRSVDLHSPDRASLLLPVSGATRSAQIVLRLDERIPSELTDGVVSLLFELQTPSSVAPQWSPEAADAEPPALVSWGYLDSSDRFMPFDLEQVHDGTDGLRRSGVVRLPITPSFATTSSATKPYEYRIAILAQRATYTFTPCCWRIVPNAVIAEHRRSVRWFDEDVTPAFLGKEPESPADQIKNWLRLPDAQLALPRPELPIMGQPALDQSERMPLGASRAPDGRIPHVASPTKLTLRERDGQLHVWTATADFAFHGPGDRCFLVDRETNSLRFGNGLNGRVPTTRPDPKAKPELFELEYEVGGGEAGNNLSAGLRWSAGNPQAAEPAKPDKMWHATSATPALGGADAESISEAIERVQAKLKQTFRAVTPRDYEDLARSTAGVAIARAHAAVGYHEDHPCTPVPGAVTVFVVPDLPEELRGASRDDVDEDLTAPKPDSGAIAAVRRHLDGARLVAHELHVRSAPYRDVALDVAIAGEVDMPEALRERITAELQAYLHPLHGGDEARGWSFGEPLRPSAIRRVVQEIVGSDLDVGRVAIQLLDELRESETCADVEIGPHGLVALRSLRVTFTPERAQEGTLL